ncbi:hypothetical protein ACFU90_22885 [Streptomyces noursei]|uniref:hypothetical protein n=1 Tax=Streptomyces noursei TaxID=1971 RepID=UPI0006E3235B
MRSEAHRRAVRPSLADLGTAKAVERQTAAMRELTRRAFPELDVVADDALAPIEQARPQRRRQAAATEALTLLETVRWGESLFAT